jgi:hypothetical protein
VFRYDPEVHPDAVRTKMRSMFAPTNRYGTHTKWDVVAIKTDGSLKGNGEEGAGLEIITVGRPISSMLKTASNLDILMEEAFKRKAYGDSCCSIHIHELTAHNHPEGIVGAGSGMLQNFPEGFTTNELTMHIPETILANQFNLIRRYELVLFWISCAGYDPKHITRWIKYRVPVTDLSPANIYMPTVRKALIKRGHGKHYSSYHYNNTQFSSTGNAEVLHTEMRTMDFIPIGKVIVSFAALMNAITIRAVELSKYGLTSVGDAEWINTQTCLINKFANTDTDEWIDKSKRHSTNILTHDDVNVIKQTGYQMLEEMHTYFPKAIWYAEDIIRDLIDKPIAFRLIDGMSLDQVKNWFNDKYTNSTKKDEVKQLIHTKLSEMICTHTKISRDNLYEHVCHIMKLRVNTTVFGYSFDAVIKENPEYKNIIM